MKITFDLLVTSCLVQLNFVAINDKAVFAIKTEEIAHVKIC